MNKGVKTGLLSLIVLSIIVGIAATASAVTASGHITLLAVFEDGDGFKGSPADVEVQITQGAGRVFIETIPLSKVDTQISTRFAKEMACKFSEVDCSRYDFFYTIKSTAGIVGGPSAGGAISALTVAMLEELDIDQETAMTGTINSGELIGPVGSLKAKIDAAKEAGIKRVLIPAVQATQNEDNVTDTVAYGKEIGVEVIPVTTLTQSVHELTGKDFEEEEDLEIDVPEDYRTMMNDVGSALCERASYLLGEVRPSDLSDDKKVLEDRVGLYKEAMNLTEKGDDEFLRGNTYSAASYCFGASVKAHTLLYQIKDLDDDESAKEAKALRSKIDEFDNDTESGQKDTITDLQTYMIVKERVLEARQRLDTGTDDPDTFGYVNERMNSALAWSTFFNGEGEKYNLDDASLKVSCGQILAEVDERFQYLNLFFPGLLEDIRNDLTTAYKHYENEEYALCIYLASRTKAEANIIVTMLGVQEEVVDEILEQKILAAKRAITRQINKGTFPIIAYSYYEYATSLKEDNTNAALLYAEYALELSDIDIYLEKTGKTAGTDLRDTLRKYMPTVVFIWGVILGILLSWIVMREKMRNCVVVARPVKTVQKPKASAIKTKTKLRLR
ncbi:MAG: S16 family serine protease [Candidatus Woesearchaeota archaeon]